MGGGGGGREGEKVVKQRQEVVAGWRLGPKPATISHHAPPSAWLQSVCKEGGPRHMTQRGLGNNAAMFANTTVFCEKDNILVSFLGSRGNAKFFGMQLSPQTHPSVLSSTLRMSLMQSAINTIAASSSRHSRYCL